jgi:broad specificity phosphatase PhoE
VQDVAERINSDHFDAIFTSDLERAYRSAEIGFGLRSAIIRDKRLRECDYGDLTQKPSAMVDAEKPKRLHEPFPNGESYDETYERMKSFLHDLRRDYGGKRVMVIGNALHDPAGSATGRPSMP